MVATTSVPSTTVAYRRDTRSLRRLVAAIVLPLGPLAVAVLRLCLPSFAAPDSLGTITTTAAAPGRADAVVWLSLALVFTLIPSALAAARLTQRRAPVLSLLGVGLLVPGFAALLFFSGDPMIRALAIGGLAPDAAAKVLDTFNAEPQVGIAAVVFVVGHIVGMVLIGVAFLRTRVVPAAVAIGVIVSQPLHLVAAVIVTNQALDGVAWGLTALGFAWAALTVLRTPDDDWDLAPGPTLRKELRMSKQVLFRTGLSIAALLALADLASPVVGPQPLAVVIISMLLGAVTIVALVPAWRHAGRAAVVTVLVTRVVSALLAVPAFFVAGVSGPVQAIAAATLALMAVSVALILAAGRSPTPSYAGSD